MSQSKFALPRNGFTFKQFFVAHDRCAMKVGTDGILLGAWAPIAGVKHVLDISVNPPLPVGEGRGEGTRTHLLKETK